MQDFTAAEQELLMHLYYVVIQVRSATGGRDGLSAEKCRRIEQLMARAVDVPRPSLPVRDPRALAVLRTFAEALAYLRRQFTAGASGTGLSAGHTRLLNRLANIMHNVPSMVSGSYGAPRFDESRYVNLLPRIDRKLGTRLEAAYRAPLDARH